jgi:hypothetical protein
MRRTARWPRLICLPDDTDSSCLRGGLCGSVLIVFDRPYIMTLAYRHGHVSHTASLGGSVPVFLARLNRYRYPGPATDDVTG